MFNEKSEPILATISAVVFVLLTVYLIVSDTDLVGPF